MKKLAVICILNLALTGCKDQQPAAVHATAKIFHTSDPISLTTPEISRMGLSTSIATMRTLPIELELAGVVKADDTMTLPILSLVPGRMDDVFAHVGDFVKKGTVLASIRSDEVARLESDLLEKDLEFEAEEKQLKMEVDLTKKVLERHKTLFADKISARADLERAENDYLRAVSGLDANREKQKAAIESANQRLKLFGIPATETQRLLRSRVVDQTFDVTAPRTGIITSRDADAGQAIDESKPLMVVSDLSKVWVVAQVFESDVKEVKQNMPVTATVNSFPGQVFSGKLDYLSSELDRDTRTLAVRATVNNPGHLLKPEMFARLKLRVGQMTQLTIPAMAVQKLGDTDIVYVETHPGTYQQRRVIIGSAVGEYVPVSAGLAAGDTVVTQGSVRLLGKVLQRQSQ